MISHSAPGPEPSTDHSTLPLTGTLKLCPFCGPVPSQLGLQTQEKEMLDIEGPVPIGASQEGEGAKGNRQQGNWPPAT